MIGEFLSILEETRLFPRCTFFPPLFLPAVDCSFYFLYYFSSYHVPVVCLCLCLVCVCELCMNGLGLDGSVSFLIISPFLVLLWFYCFCFFFFYFVHISPSLYISFSWVGLD